MKTARAPLGCEEFCAIHPLRDFTSPRTGEALEHLFEAQFFWGHIFDNPFEAHFFGATSLTIRFSELKWNQSTSWVGMASAHDPSPALHLLSPAAAPPPHSFICSFSAAKIFQRCTNTKNSSWVTLSHPLVVIHAVHIFIYHRQKTSQDWGKSHVLLKPVFRVINHESFISYRTTSWLLFLRVVFKELWKPLIDYRKINQQTCFESVRMDSWKSGLLPCPCTEDLLWAMPSAARELFPKKPCQILHPGLATTEEAALN